MKGKAADVPSLSCAESVSLHVSVLCVQHRESVADLHCNSLPSHTRTRPVKLPL